jgi:hypothetical protein
VNSSNFEQILGTFTFLVHFHLYGLFLFNILYFFVTVNNFFSYITLSYCDPFTLQNIKFLSQNNVSLHIIFPQPVGVFYFHLTFISCLVGIIHSTFILTIALIQPIDLSMYLYL